MKIEDIEEQGVNKDLKQIYQQQSNNRQRKKYEYWLDRNYKDIENIFQSHTSK